MTLYLKAVIGPTTYLIATDRVSDVRPADDLVQDNAARTIDCRELFGMPATAMGCRVLVEPEVGDAVSLVVDRLDGLAELPEDSFRAVPPIGRFGAAIDAVCQFADSQDPALRLQLGPALFGAAGVV